MGTQRAVADLVLQNAKIYTMDETHPWASAFAVRAGKLVAIGSAATVEPQIGAETEIIDAEGQTVLPGLLDSHSHAFEGARAALYEIRFSTADDLNSMIAAVEKAANRLGGDGWLRGAGWSAGKLIEQLSSRSALRALDEATGIRPTVLRDSSHHAIFANSAAMRMAGLSPDVHGEPNGSIGRYSDGALSGLFLETACGLIDKAIPAPSADERRTTALHAAGLYHSFGVTGFVQAAISEATLDIFNRLDQNDELNVWIAACIATNSLLTPEQEGIGEAVIGRRDAYRSAHIGVDFVKIFMDGVPAARTAAFHEPYANSGSDLAERTPPFHHVAELYDLIRMLDARGIHVKVHAVGDRAIQYTLDAIEAVRHTNGSSGPQHSIAHLSYIAEKDIPRLASLNVAADFCPPLWFPNPILHANDLALGEGRGARAWPIGDIVRAGTLSMLGTDWPITASPNPWPGLAGLITRRDPKRETPGIFRPEQALSLNEALPLCTINVARHMGFGEQTGSISIGKCADFILLDRDLFEIEPEAIADTTVLRTYFAGQPVYRA